MKVAWSTYHWVVVLLGLLISSCEEESLPRSCLEEKAEVQLYITLCPDHGKSSSRALPANTRDGSEAGSSYENTMAGTDDMHLFVFNKINGTFLGEAVDMSMIGLNDPSARLIQGRLPGAALGKEVRMVFMANYGSRSAVPSLPGVSQLFGDWKSSLTFDYGSSPWTVSDMNVYPPKYIPMSGECLLQVESDPKFVNHAEIVLKRAVAKVRIRVVDSCEYRITSLQTHNASVRGYSLEQEVFAVPFTHGGLYQTLNFVDLDISAGRSYEFYLPEQPAGQTTLQLGMDDGTLKDRIEFKYYPDGEVYPILRNHIYEFVVDKNKEEAKADIQVTVSPWTIYEISTVYE